MSCAKQVASLNTSSSLAQSCAVHRQYATAHGRGSRINERVICGSPWDRGDVLKNIRPGKAAPAPSGALQVWHSLPQYFTILTRYKAALFHRQRHTHVATQGVKHRPRGCVRRQDTHYISTHLHCQSLPWQTVYFTFQSTTGRPRQFLCKLRTDEFPFPSGELFRSTASQLAASS